jgi:ABC-type transport system involved in multi-copper enzyme maturation permease subunit
MSANHEDDLVAIERHVGPFAGFGNFFMKEIFDWWKSWRLIVVFLLTTLLTLLIVFTAFDATERQFQRDQDRKQVAEHRQQQVDNQQQEAGPAGKRKEPMPDGKRKDLEPQANERGNADRDEPKNVPPIDKKAVATILILFMIIVSPLFYVFIIIFSTMGLLTTEKSTGTLAWNLTKPLGRTGLFTAKWLAATMMLWLACFVVPVLIASLALTAYHGVSPEFDTVFMVVAISLLWIAFWVLLVLMISLGFQSQAAVGGIALACFLIPYLFFEIMEHMMGIETRDLILDRWSPLFPSKAFSLVAKGPYRTMALIQGIDADKKGTLWMLSFAVWFVVMSVLSLRIFNRQEIGS